MKNKYPRVLDLKKKAIMRIPFFCSEYLFSGTANDKVVKGNADIFNHVFLTPKYLKGTVKPSTKQSIIGMEYSAPFGVAPMGSAGLIWGPRPSFGPDLIFKSAPTSSNLARNGFRIDASA